MKEVYKAESHWACFSFLLLLLFLWGCEWTGSWRGERQLCKWDMPAKNKMSFYSACIDERLLLHCEGTPLRWPVAWSVWVALKKEWHRSICSPRVLRLAPPSSHHVKHGLPYCSWEPDVLSPTLVQGNHHRGRQSQEEKPWVPLGISSKGWLQQHVYI